MPITDLLERKSKLCGEEIALVEINPEFTVEQVQAATEATLIVSTDLTPMC